MLMSGWCDHSFLVYRDEPYIANHDGLTDKYSSYLPLLMALKEVWGRQNNCCYVVLTLRVSRLECMQSTLLGQVSSLHLQA